MGKVVDAFRAALAASDINSLRAELDAARDLILKQSRASIADENLYGNDIEANKRTIDSLGEAVSDLYSAIDNLKIEIGWHREQKQKDAEAKGEHNCEPMPIKSYINRSSF